MTRRVESGIACSAFLLVSVLAVPSLRAQNGILGVVPGVRPVAVAIDTAANEAFVLNSGSREVVVLDLNSHEVKTRYAVGALPGGIAFNPQTKAIVVTSPAGMVTTIDHAFGRVGAAMAVGKSPMRVAIDSVKNVALVTDFTGANLILIDLAAQKITGTIGLKNGAFGIALLEDRRRAVVACQYDMELLLVDLDNHKVDKEFLAGRFLSEVAVDSAAGHVIFVDPSSGGEIMVYDPDRDAIVSTLALGAGPLSVAVYPKRNVALVSLYNASRVVLVDLQKNRIITSIRVARGPLGMAIHPETGIAVVASKLADRVTFLDIEAILKAAPAPPAPPAAPEVKPPAVP